MRETSEFSPEILQQDDLTFQKIGQAKLLESIKGCEDYDEVIKVLKDYKQINKFSTKKFTWEEQKIIKQGYRQQALKDDVDDLIRLEGNFNEKRE